MPGALSSEYAWQFSAPSPILGLHQEDREGVVGLFDNAGGLYLLDEKGTRILELEFNQPILALHVLRERKGVIVLDHAGWLSRFDLSGKKVWEQKVDTMAVSMHARSDGAGIAVGCANGLLNFYNGYGKKLRSLYLTHPIEFVRFAYDLPYIVAANSRGEFSMINAEFKFEWKVNMQTQCCGIDVDCNASLILLTALVEGVYAFNEKKESLGAYDVGAAIMASALSQKGDRILAVNKAGRLHVINRQGVLEYFLDTNAEIPRLDLNYGGDLVAFQSGDYLLKTLRFIDQNGHQGPTETYRALREEIGGPSTGKLNIAQNLAQPQKLWEKEIDGGGQAQVRLTAHGAYCIALSEMNVFAIWDAEGTNLHTETLDPGLTHRLFFSRAGNTVLIANQDYVDYFTGDGHKVKRISTRAEQISVHDLGVNFAIATVDSKLGLFNNAGECVWSKVLGIPILDIEVSPSGKDIFAACSDDTLRLFRQEGKVGWETKLVPKDHKIILDSNRVQYNSKPIYSASDGFIFKDKVISSAANFVLSREGILLGRNDGQLFFLNEKGQTKWEQRVSSAIVHLENLGQVFLARTKDGKEYLFDLSGKLLYAHETTPGLRQYVKDNAKNLLLIESVENTLSCTDVLKKEKRWEIKGPGKITQFHLDLTGSKLAFITDGNLQCYLTQPDSGADTAAAVNCAAFLEF